jgi:hypothetical protein
MNTNFKIGDKVFIKDGSYMTTVVDGIISHCDKHNQHPGKIKTLCTIIAFGVFPTDNINSYRENTHDPNSPITTNNTMIVDKNGTVWYCHANICLKKDNSIKLGNISSYLCIATSNNSSQYKGDAFYLSSQYNWSIKKDNDGLYLIPTLK